MKCLRIVLIGLFILLSACGGSAGDEYDEFSFTAEDAEKISALLDEIEGGGTTATDTTDSVGSDLVPGATQEAEIVLKASDAHRFDHLRTSISLLDANTFRITNAFLNVRTAPSIRSEQVEELKQGNHVKLISFHDAQWAEIELPDGRKGFVSASYISQVVTEETLPEVKKKYEGQYEVNFAFLNVRSEPTSQGQKLGELSGHQIVKPLAFLPGKPGEPEWAKIAFEGKEGYVSAQYLRPFFPTFIVRQEKFKSSILRYAGDDKDIAKTLVQHLAFLKSAGKKIITLREFYDLLNQQESRDIRISHDTVILVFSDLTSESLKDISDALRASGAMGTFFIKTSDIGPSGIEPQILKTLAANGHDLQSSGHSGDDLRAMTSSNITSELMQSRQILEELSGKDVFAVSYAGGGVNDRVAGQAIEAGYLFGLTFTPGVGQGFDRSQFLRLPTNLVTAATSEAVLKALLGMK